MTSDSRSKKRALTLVKRGDDCVVVLPERLVPPITGFGKMVARQTSVVPKNDVALLSDEDATSFENVTIAFPLDLITGAAFVDNEDNWGIGAQGLQAQKLWDLGARGQGVRVGIPDSGIDLSHPTFKKLKDEARLVAFAEFDKQGNKRVQVDANGASIPDTQAVPTFSHWHGTHCAAIVAGQKTDGKDRGMAPGIELVVVRVLEQANEGSVAGIAAGLWWLVDQQCDVVSISLGWPGKHEEWADPIAELLKGGAVVLAAVGNEFGFPGVDPSRSPANYPLPPTAAEQGLLVAVGAHDDTKKVWEDSGGEQVDWSAVRVKRTDGTTKPSRFSSVPPFVVPSMVAPGVDIISAVPNNRYYSSPGSSMATPHAAGLVALVLSHLRARDATATPRQAIDLVLQSLVDIAPTGVDIRSGSGVVDVAKLIATLPA